MAKARKPSLKTKRSNSTTGARRRSLIERRSQAVRRESGLSSILSASIDLLISEGVVGFSASKVAMRAGISRGALEHYFPTRRGLIAATTLHAMKSAVSQAHAFVLSAEQSSDPVTKFLKSSESFFFSPDYRAMTEVMIAARTERQLARLCYPIIRSARLELDKIWTETFNRAGYNSDSSRRFITMTHFLLRGIFLAETWLPYEFDRADVIREWQKSADVFLRDGANRGTARRRKFPHRNGS